MKTAPKALRVHIGLFGRTNVGKSSFLNMISGQDVSIISSVPGTTTDVVEKTMELLPVGPVVFLDTAGIDDTSVLATERIKRTRRIFGRSDIIVLIVEPNTWTDFEEQIMTEAKTRAVPCIVVINKIDIIVPADDFMQTVTGKTEYVMCCSCTAVQEQYRDIFRKAVLSTCPDDFLKPPPLIGDLLSSGGLAVLIVPIDLQAPKGRLILPQVQTIRDALDNDAGTLVVKEREYAHMLMNLKIPPDIVVCDSQVVLKMVADTPKDIKCTTFSILFSRYKGDLLESVRGVVAIEKLQPGDKVLIAESCSHHPMEDDIGRVKIPRWLRQYIGADITIDVFSGRDYPDNLKEYKVVIHCGGCMLTRREMLFRIHKAREAGVAITNYGLCISYVQGVLARALSPFPAALEILKS